MIFYIICGFLLSILPVSLEAMDQEQTKLGVSYDAAEGIGGRGAMEDYHICIPSFDGDTQQAFFAVYDGHTGKGAAEYAAQHLHTVFLESKQTRSIKEAFEYAFKVVDEDFCLGDHNNAGTTAVCVYINHNTAHIAWVGDSRAVVVRNGNVEYATTDHNVLLNPKSSKEQRRATTGEILRIRQLGMGKHIDDHGHLAGLAMSRAIGDQVFKKYGVIAEPSYMSIQLREGDQVVVASDGVWNFIKNAELPAILDSEINNPEMQGIARLLRDESFRRHDKLRNDNVAAIVIKIAAFDGDTSLKTNAGIKTNEKKLPLLPSSSARISTATVTGSANSPAISTTTATSITTFVTPVTPATVEQPDDAPAPVISTTTTTIDQPAGSPVPVPNTTVPVITDAATDAQPTDYQKALFPVPSPDTEASTIFTLPAAACGVVTIIAIGCACYAYKYWYAQKNDEDDEQDLSPTADAHSAA